MDKEIKEAQLNAARALVSALESGDEAAAQTNLKALAEAQESQLFKEVGRLTRDLHDSLNNFNLDGRLAELTESEMPNTRERLNFVIDTTEEAAHKTLGYI
ncbi:hypothetical protein LCGC14_3139360, partial [marine sediment metagenome]